MPTFLDPVVLKQYITEYETKRKEKLSTFSGYIGNVISSLFGGANSLDIDNTCKGFKKSFVEERTPKEQVKTLLKLGRTSWISQNLKLSNNVPYGFQTFAQLWIDSASDYSKNLSAIRNDMLQQILSDAVLADENEQIYRTQVRAELETQLIELDRFRAERQVIWYQAIKEKKSADDIKKYQIDYDASIRDLAYLGNDFYVLTSGRLEELFPGVEYSKEVKVNALDAELNRENLHKPNPNIPNILQLIYAEMYMRSDLSHRLGDDATVDGFSKLARKEYEAQTKAGNVNSSSSTHGTTPRTSVSSSSSSTVTTPQNSVSGTSGMNLRRTPLSSPSTPIVTTHTHLKIDTSSSPAISAQRSSLDAQHLPPMQLSTSMQPLNHVQEELNNFDEDDFNIESQDSVTAKKSSTATLLATLSQTTTASISSELNADNKQDTNTATSSSSSVMQNSSKSVFASLPTVDELKKLGYTNKKAREHILSLKQAELATEKASTQSAPTHRI